MSPETYKLFSDFFDISTIPFYILGVIVFFISIIDDLASKEKKGFWWYLQDFFYSIIAVSIGISCCYLCELPKAACWIIVIGCAFIGSTIFKKIDSKKDTLSNDAIDRVADATINTVIKKIEKKICQEKEQENSEMTNDVNN